MKAHVIENGVVVNTIEVDSLGVLPDLVDASNGGAIGELWDGLVFSPPARPANWRSPKVSEDNTRIKAQLAAADLDIIRALAENNTEKIKAHVEAQKLLRARLK